MDKIMVNGVEQELKFTFNSFKYMQDFTVDIFEGVESHPFKILPICSMLLTGALNNSPKNYFDEDEVYACMEEYAETESVSVLLAALMEKLQASSFFKSLQTKPKK